MTLLTMVADAATKIGVSTPTTVIGNTDTEVTELLAYAQEEGYDLMRRHDWQLITAEKTFTSVATETQTGAIPSDFDRFVNETFWNRSRYSRLYGPLTPQDWQAIKANGSSPITDCFRVRGSNILIQPVPPAGQTMAYEYIKNTFCQSSGATAQAAWAADTDTGILNEKTMSQGIVVRFKMSKGIAYDEDLAKYESMVANDILSEMPRGRVDLSYQSMSIRPSIGVQEGNWNVS